MEKNGVRNFARSAFFTEDTYRSEQNREMPCYLISKMGCEMVANKLTGEKGVLFTAAYVTKFNEMETADRAAEIEFRARPCLNEFNSAVRTVLSGMSYCRTRPNRVMDFLRGVYEPLGIEVEAECDDFGYYSATEIAEILGLYSDTGRPHGHAVSAIISKLDISADHAIVVPYGLVGVAMRYDWSVIEAVLNWIVDNDQITDVPHLDFCYHVYYAHDSIWLDDAGGDARDPDSN